MITTTTTTATTTATTTTATRKYEASLQQHAFFVQQKARFLIAFAATILLLCIEHVKAFAAPLSNPDTLLFMASGAHSVAKRYRSTTNNKPVPSPALNIRQTATAAATTDETGGGSGGHDHSQSSSSRSQSFSALHSQMLSRTQRNSLTSLRMAFGFGELPKGEDAPPTLDMRTSLNAFGSWYNKMDPVARPPDYDDEETDYSLSSPADNWPSSFEEEAAVSFTSTAAYSTNPRSSTNHSNGRNRQSSLLSKAGRIPRPIRTIRKIAGWVLGSSGSRNARGFGSQNFL